jgi:hypothetical protein
LTCWRRKASAACFYHLAYAGRGEDQKFDLTPEQTRWAVNYVFDRAEDFQARGVEKEILTVDNHADNVLLYLRVKEREPKRATEILRMLEWNGGNQSGIAIGCVTHGRGARRPVLVGYSSATSASAFSEIWRHVR